MVWDLTIIIILVLSTVGGVIIGIRETKTGWGEGDLAIFLVAILISFVSCFIMNIKHDISISVAIATCAAIAFFISDALTLFCHLLWILFIPAIKEFFKKIYSHYSV